MSSSKVKVAVRVRPFSRRELDLGTKCIVDMAVDDDLQQTILHNPCTGAAGSKSSESSRKSPKTFAFDHCFWSIDANDSAKFSGQEDVFEKLGQDVLENALEGYNACIFAYGQTGSGKSYTMMGAEENKGIIPRLCDVLFDRIAFCTDENLCYKVEVSYLEIYNEKVRDLLDPKGTKQNLRVREHNILGPYVDGLSTLAVSSFQDIDSLMSEGNKSRTVAATNMNSESSRSHAVFNIKVTQTLVDPQSGVSGEKVSKVSLVDLAGSERAQKSGAIGERLKEGSNINKSLTTLGLVISALADQSSGHGKLKNKFVPYRDSVLTWLLKDNLGGNSKTVMVATISPSADNYEETLSTLRYADRAKRIVNHAVVNEDPNAKIIRELREEVELLRAQLNESMQADDLKERLLESEKLVTELSRTWEDKLEQTERVHRERQQALEKMGISVQTSGIKVETNKYFLVNLNADPSLNELLVYYLKDHTLVGRPDAPVEQDIQLSGLGIMPEHCIVEIVQGDVYMAPLEGARTCVNGSLINDRTLLRHGDRVLWGNNHFFRINCPRAIAKTPSMAGLQVQSPDQPERPIDYEFAREELMMKEMSNDPIQAAMSALERQHEEDKQGALEKQRKMYEEELERLKREISPCSTPSIPYGSLSDLQPMKFTSHSNLNARFRLIAEEKDKMFKQSLAKLREEVVRANAVVREANYLAEELGKQTEFNVTLQIPAANLSPNRKRGAFVSEPAILVKRKGKGKQVWSLEKLENRIIDMREMYEERKEDCGYTKEEEPSRGYDPFYESQENHNLIGVANVFLEVLFHDAKLDYQVPIISQQGDVAGRLHVELSRVSGTLGCDRIGDAELDESDLSRSAMDDDTTASQQITVKVVIKEALRLPPHLSNFVFCQYNFWGQSEAIVVAPDINPEGLIQIETPKRGATFHFNHENEIVVPVTDEFIEHCMDGALSIEVWGHRSTGFGTSVLGGLDMMDSINAKTRSLSDRWREVKRRLELRVEIHELNDQGEYAPVELVPKPEIFTGGVFQLRQGHSRRILVQVKPVRNSGTLPLICESITSISIGSVCARSKLQKGLDSYQEEDLNLLREKWSDALYKRREYLDEQIQKIINKKDKNDSDIEREQSLIDQWVCLTEERNAVLVPAAGSGIPGEPADGTPMPAGMEEHTPVIFLDLNADDMSTSNYDGLQGAGINSILPKEHGTKFFSLPIVKYSEHDLSDNGGWTPSHDTAPMEVCALASWDSSIHDSPFLNRVTPANERVYLILRATVQLSHPAYLELILRKRICINVYKKQSFTEKIFKRIGMQWETQHTASVMYEVVSNIPKASEDIEDRETLALMAAASGANADQEQDGQSYIERYIHGVSAVESILTLDRLRQEVEVKELLAASGKTIRKTASVPNISNKFGLLGSLTQPSPVAKLETECRAESVTDVSRMSPDFSIPSHQYVTSWEKEFRRKSLSDTLRNKGDRAPNKDLKTPFSSLARPTFLNLRPQTYVSAKSKSAPADDNSSTFIGIMPKSGASPQTGKAVTHLSTLLEEQQHRAQPTLLEKYDKENIFGNNLDNSTKNMHLENGDAFSPSEDYVNFVSYDSRPNTKEGFSRMGTFDNIHKSAMYDELPRSATIDSLTDTKNLPPSVTSSGYGSQGFSHTLSSEDSMSLHSISIDETPDIDSIRLRDNTLDNFDEDQENCESGDENMRDVKEDSSTLIEDLDEENREMCAMEDSLKDQSLLDFGDIPDNIAAPLEPISSPISNDNVNNVKVEEESVQHTIDTGVFRCPLSGAILSENLLSQSSVLKNNGRHAASIEFSENSDSRTNVTKDNVLINNVQHSQLDSTRNDRDNLENDKNSNILLLFDNGPEQNFELEQSDILSSNTSNLSPESKNNRGDKDIMPDQEPLIDLTTTNASISLEPAEKGGFHPELTHISKQLNIDEQRPKSDSFSSSCADDERLSDSEEGSTCSFGSRADIHRATDPLPSWISPGVAVCVSPYNLYGFVRYVGTADFASGTWVGVELDKAAGKNNGMVKGRRYFTCKPKHGLFVRHDKLVLQKRKGHSAAALSPAQKTLRIGSGTQDKPEWPM